MMGQQEGKRPLGKPRRMCVNNMKMNLLEIVSRAVDWIGEAGVVWTGLVRLEWCGLYW
jgi:hypothetical protein